MFWRESHAQAEKEDGRIGSDRCSRRGWCSPLTGWYRPPSAAEREVYVGGMPAGFTLGMDGAQIVGFCEVLTKEGTRSPAKEAGLEAGDLILSLGGVMRVIRLSPTSTRRSARAGAESGEIVVRRGGERVKAEPAFRLRCDAASGRAASSGCSFGTVSQGSAQSPISSRQSALRISRPCRRGRGWKDDGYWPGRNISVQHCRRGSGRAGQGRRVERPVFE